MYYIAAILLLASFFKSKKKTKMALKKSWKSISNILPKFLAVICLVGIMLSIFNEELVSSMIGSESGLIGVFISSIVGSITLIPGFIAFPTAKVLLENGAGVAQVAVFISTLMMVGIMTLPLEIEYFGKRVALLRNSFSLVLSYIAAFIISRVVGGVWF